MATTGQTPGLANGQLPDGYLPMTISNGLGSLRAYSLAAAAAVQAQQGYVPATDGSTKPPGASPSPTPSTIPSTGPPPDQGGTGTDTGSTGGGVDTGGSATPSASPSASVTPSPSVIVIRNAALTTQVPVGLAGQAVPALLALALITGVAALVTTSWGRR
jgi:hypothetical protein